MQCSTTGAYGCFLCCLGIYWRHQGNRYARYVQKEACAAMCAVGNLHLLRQASIVSASAQGLTASGD